MALDDDDLRMRLGHRRRLGFKCGQQLRPRAKLGDDPGGVRLNDGFDPAIIREVSKRLNAHDLDSEMLIDFGPLGLRRNSHRGIQACVSSWL